MRKSFEIRSPGNGGVPIIFHGVERLKEAVAMGVIPESYQRYSDEVQLMIWRSDMYGEIAHMAMSDIDSVENDDRRALYQDLRKRAVTWDEWESGAVVTDLPPEIYSFVINPKTGWFMLVVEDDYISTIDYRRFRPHVSVSGSVVAIEIDTVEIEIECQSCESASTVGSFISATIQNAYNVKGE